MHFLQTKSALQAYINVKHYKEASKLYEEDKQYPNSIQALLDGKLYVEAAAKAKRFEESGISLSDDLSSIKIAMKNIKKYGKPKWDHEAEGEKFNGLLEYIVDEEMKIAFIKNAKRFNEALESHFKSHQYSEFYRLALAQGPNVIPSTESSNLSTITYYDCALHLSSVCGHLAIHKAFVINSARSCCTKFASGSISPKLLTELEKLSQTNSAGVETQLNAHLLLARHDKSKIPEAMKVCDHYHCLPMEVELGLLWLSNEEQPTSFFIHIAYKILFLLSLDPSTLHAAYEEMLGIHRGETDEVYLKQECYAEDLGKKFESDCYLLPHESQDIWIETLTIGKDVTRDTDGMYVILSEDLFKKVSKHLTKSLEKILIELFTRISSSSLYKFIMSGEHLPLIGFDPEAISSCLEYYQLILHSANYTEFHTHEAIKILRQYHSIMISCNFPLCINYVSWMEHMRSSAWKLFQSKTREWIRTHVSETTQNDFLKLWEQASIGKLKQSLKRDLESLVEFEMKREKNQSDDSEVLSCYRTAIKWVDVCDKVIDDPLGSCHIFFNECSPKFITLGFNLRSVVDSISIYGTIVLALMSCVSGETHTPPIIIPHMYSRALSVYDSLLPKAQWQTILMSCCDQGLSKRGPPTKEQLLQHLHCALAQIESLLLIESLNEYSDLSKRTIVLMLTLYMNYAMFESRSPDIFMFHSRFVLCLQQRIGYDEEKLNHQAICNAFEQATYVSNLLRIVKHLLSPRKKGHKAIARHESLAVITFSKHHRRIYIEPANNEDIKLPNVRLVSQAQKVEKKQNIKVSPLLPEGERQHYLTLRLPRYKHVYPLRTAPSDPQWMYYKECGEEVAECMQEFITLASCTLEDPMYTNIKRKSLFQQLLLIPDEVITNYLRRLQNLEPTGSIADEV